MKLKMLSIYDQASKAFLPPFVVATVDIALRQLVKVMQEQPKHDFVLFGDQYTLYELGDWDNETGVFSEYQVSLGSLQVLRSRVRVVAAPSEEQVMARNPSMGSDL